MDLLFRARQRHAKTDPTIRVQFEASLEKTNELMEPYISFLTHHNKCHHSIPLLSHWLGCWSINLGGLPATLHQRFFSSYPKNVLPSYDQSLICWLEYRCRLGKTKRILIPVNFQVKSIICLLIVASNQSFFHYNFFYQLCTNYGGI